MGTQSNPDLVIEWYNSALTTPAWVSLLANSKSFKVEGGGIRKIAGATLRLLNKDGKYTQGAEKITKGKLLRIKVDVRGTVDQIFEGKVYRKEGDDEGKDEYLTLVARGRGQRYDDDTLTCDFTSEQNQLTIKEAIEYALSNPDSGISIGSLTTDAGDITTKIPAEDPNGQSIRDFLLDCMELINYDGWAAFTSANLYLYAWATQACSPVVTLTEPYLFVKPVEHIDDLASYIMVQGGTDIGVPAKRNGDFWTEYDYSTTPQGPVARYSPALWVGNNCTMHDCTTDHAVGDLSIEARNHNVGETPSWNANLSIAASEYYDIYGYVDARNRFNNGLKFRVKPHERTAIGNWNTHTFRVKLVDSNGIIIAYKPTAQPTKNAWTGYAITIGSGESIAGSECFDQWYYDLGEDFDWQNIAEIQFYITVTYTPDGTSWQGELLLDEVFFSGGYDINPIVNPSITPVCWAKDESAPTWPVVFRHEDFNIVTFDKANAIATETLAELKQKFRMYEVGLPQAYPYVRNSQTLTFTYDNYGVDAETWVIVHFEHEWNRDVSKKVYTTLKIMPQTV